jgi:hypothetical protein
MAIRYTVKVGDTITCPQCGQVYKLERDGIKYFTVPLTGGCEHISDIVLPIRRHNHAWVFFKRKDPRCPVCGDKNTSIAHRASHCREVPPDEANLVIYEKVGAGLWETTRVRYFFSPHPDCDIAIWMWVTSGCGDYERIR